MGILVLTSYWRFDLFTSSALIRTDLHDFLTYRFSKIGFVIQKKILALPISVILGTLSNEACPRLLFGFVTKRKGFIWYG